jgi:PhnB protein
LPGNAEEAMNFYKGVFGGEITITRWGEMPPNPKMPISNSWKNKIMHGSLEIVKGVTIYFTDSMKERKVNSDNNVYIHVEFDSENDVRKAYEILSEDGKVNMPLDKTFWGAIYGDLLDKYGIFWGLHYQLSE